MWNGVIVSYKSNQNLESGKKERENTWALPIPRIGPFYFRNETTITRSDLSAGGSLWLARAGWAVGCTRWHGELREERRDAQRNFRNTEQAWILRILESIHYSTRTAAVRRKIEPPCVRHPFYGSFAEWSMADYACFTSLVRVFPHDSLASPLFSPPHRSFRPTAD